MRTPIAALLVAACSSAAPAPTLAPRAAPPSPPSAPTPVATPPVAAVSSEPEPVPERSPVEPPPTWQPHKCQRSVTRYGFEAYPEPVEPGEAVPSYPSDEELGGTTLDDKLAVLNRTRKSGGVCDTRRRTTIAADLLKLRRPPPAASSRAGWDHTTPPAYRDLVRNALGLTPAEETQLARDGFVVPERLAYQTYTTAYYDVHRAQLPVYVTADSILHAIYISHDHLFSDVESHAMVGRLDAALGAMHCGLAAAAKQYPKDVARDIDLYLTVARSLLAGQHVPSELGPEGGEAAAPLLALIADAGGPQAIELFGRTRNFDASQYTPRGHYTDESRGLDKYFRAAMWLSRVELNLVSRDTRSSQPGENPDPRETPREAIDALALADLAQRSGALADLAALDAGWASIAGKREDVSVPQLLALRKRAGITKLDGAAAAKLRAAIGDGFVRTVNLHPNPAVSRLPVIATLLGPRITPDTAALWTLASGRGQDVRAAELGFVLGHDRALAHLSPTSGKPAPLREARAQLAAAPMGDDLYSAWLAAIRALAERPRGAVPSFVDTDAYRDLRLDTALAAYGQLRHNHVLVQAGIYDQGGCEIPDGYVEPAPATYRALAAYAKRGRALFAQLDPKRATTAVAYFARLERLMNVLAALADEQLAGRPLSVAAKRFLAMIVERRVVNVATYTSSFPVATFDGWYLDLFPTVDAGLKDAAFIADYVTFDRDGASGIHYLGAKGPHLGVFVVDAGGPPRLMVGPVADAFEHTGPLDRRLSDAEAEVVPGDPPWAKSYTVPAPAVPSFDVEFARAEWPASSGPRARRRDLPPSNTLRIDTKAPLGALTVELLDHHFVAMQSVTLDVGAGRTEQAMPATPRPVEAMWLKTATWQQRLDLNLDGTLSTDGP